MLLLVFWVGTGLARGVLGGFLVLGFVILLVWSFAPNGQLLRPLLTSRADLHRRPFRRKARSPQVRTTAQTPDLRRLSLDHERFAVICPLALLGNALYPVLVGVTWENGNFCTLRKLLSQK